MLQFDSNGNIVVSGNTTTGVTGQSANTPTSGMGGSYVTPTTQTNTTQPTMSTATTSPATSGATPQTSLYAGNLVGIPQDQLYQQYEASLAKQASSIQTYLQGKAQNGEVSSSDAISALNTANTNPGVLDGSVPSGISADSQSAIQGLLNNMNQQIQFLENNPVPSYTDLYKQLYNQPDQSGTSLAQYGQQIANLKNQELFQPQQVAQQGQGFGFMTAEQQQGITNQRNQAIDNHIQALGNLAGLQQNYVNQIMTLTGQDQSQAAARAEKIFGLQDKVATLLNTMDNQDFRRQIMVANLQRQDTSAALLDSLRQIEISNKQGGAGTDEGSTITYSLAKELGLPNAFIGQKTSVLGMESSVPPQWFTAKVQNEANSSITPSELQNQWDSFRFSVPAAPTASTLTKSKTTQLVSLLGVNASVVDWIAEQKAAGATNDEILNDPTNGLISQGYPNAQDIINSYDNSVGQGINVPVTQ